MKAVRNSYKEILLYQIAREEGSSQFYLKSYNNDKIIEFVIQGNQMETSCRQPHSTESLFTMHWSS